MMESRLLSETSAALDWSAPYAERKKYYVSIKRLADIAFSLAGLLLSSPLLLAAMAAIYAESPGPVFYVQERVGWKGSLFKVIKLRSMRLDAEKNGAQWAEKNDPRITKVGSFLRKTRIDEIPQLINVLRGEMSLIGPRPERPVFVARFNEEIPGFVGRLLVKPGLTGWAQINGGYEITPREKLELDMYYIQHFSFRLDMKILLRTVKVVLTGDGAR
ncbi:exopolysaccharide biosynthesis polyprenyl glycosylphosphotransferase [Cohnella caldifontis]|uniref:exopolysaccharide biosynthesis polyprenyl glycosylphosphotransferase n=1 Tax=Cohnella caldifontis TaxID=3027471 RepID=UPI0023ED8035|nr:exopolysaccharide biosynthesis polyprenyl glycosylphosphotransferase [Cohnella sp. YIM B05605]